MQLRFKKPRIKIITMALMSFLAVATSASAMDINWKRVEGYANGVFQVRDGNGYAIGGGARYTPTFRIIDNLDLKPYLGAFGTKGQSTGPYAIVDYGVAAQSHHLANFVLEAGFGALTSFQYLKNMSTGLFVFGGPQYKLSSPLFDVFFIRNIDRVIASAGYVFGNGGVTNSLIFNLGLGLSF